MNFFWNIWTIFAAFFICSFTYLLFVPAPYGKFTRKGFGPLLSSKWSWLIQESPCILWTLYFLYTGENIKIESKLLTIVLLMHYIYRNIIYGFLIPSHSKTTLVVFCSAIFFNAANGYIQVSGLMHYDLPETSINSFRFWLGLCIWLFFLCFNIGSDAILRSLRKSGEKKYGIPYGGLFTYVSCANYLTETLLWLGWAIACKNWSGWLFLVVTIANLLPRSLSCHHWYLENFKDYASLNRKAYIPFIL